MPFFETDLASFHYETYGTGEYVMLAFHGFGMRGTQFRHLEPSLGRRYRIYSFDLFFHGETRLRDDGIASIVAGISPEAFALQMKLFLLEANVPEKKIGLLAYSMGASLACAVLQNMPETVAEVFFIAADGIEPNKLLRAGGSFRPVNRLLYKLVYSPATVNYCLRLLRKLRYIDEALFQVLGREFGTTESRLISYNTITFHSKLVFKKEELAKLINAHQIACYLYFGKKDVLFPPAVAQRFARLLLQCNLHISDGGHDLVNPALNDVIAQQLTCINNDKG